MNNSKLNIAGGEPNQIDFKRFQEAVLPLLYRMFSEVVIPEIVYVLRNVR